MPEEITSNLYKISAEGNVYLILKPVPTLIDTSDSQNKDFIKSEIEQIIPCEKIKNILLTHLHYDHCGNINLFPNAKVYAQKDEIEIFKKSPESFTFTNMDNKSIQTLKNKLQPLPKEILGLEVLKTPGHTVGSVAFLDRADKFVYSGDTVFDTTIGRTDLPTSNESVMDESVAKIHNLLLEGYELMPGHDY